MSSGSTAVKVGKILVAVLLGVLIVFLVAELGMRWYVAKQFKDGFQEQIPPGVTVEHEPDMSFGAYPLTLSMFTRNVPQVTMQTPSTLTIHEDSTEGVPAARVAISDLTLSEEMNAGRLRVTSELPDDYLEAVLQEQIQRAVDENTQRDYTMLVDQLGISDVVANPSSGTFDIAAAHDILAIELRPVMVNDQLSFEVASTSVFGQTLPDEVSSGIEQFLQEGLQENLVGTLQVQEFTVIPDGFRITLTGQDVNLSELGGNSPAQQP